MFMFIQPSSEQTVAVETALLDVKNKNVLNVVFTLNYFEKPFKKGENTSGQSQPIGVPVVSVWYLRSCISPDEAFPF